MTGLRKTVFGILAAMSLILLVTCGMLPGNLEDGVISLSVGGGGGSRALEVKEYDVESLDLEIYGPDPEDPGTEILIWDEHWAAPDPETYLIQGIGPGAYRIVVTHNGVNGDENLSVTEEAEFGVAAMRITRISVIPGMLGVLEVDGTADPVDLSGHWTVTWELVNDTIVTPLYLDLLQTGDEVEFSYGVTGTLAGDNLYYTDAFIPDLFCYGNLDATVAPDGNSFSGPFSLLGSPGGAPVVHPEFPEWGEFTGVSIYERTDPELFGALTLSGTVDWGERDDYGTPIIMGSTLMDYATTDDAMAFFSIENEDGMVWDALDISVTDMENDTDIMLFLGFEPNLAVGDFSVSTLGPPASPNAWIDGLYLVGGSGTDEGQFFIDGTLSITYWDGSRVSGYLIPDGESEHLMDFDIPIAPISPW